MERFTELMKIIITENQILQIISEASKKEFLLNKIGFNEENSDILDRLCGQLSVWMGNKIIEFIYFKNKKASI